MKPELMLVVWAVLLTFVQMLIAVSGATLQVGLPALAGNREGLAPCTGLAGRAARAHPNKLESLVLFAAPVLVAGAAGQNKSPPPLCAQNLFWGPGGFAAAFPARLPWLRHGI